LDIERNGSLGVLPEWIGELKNLQVLKIDETDIQDIPSSILKLDNLHALKAAFAPIKSGIENIYRLKNLKNLAIRADKPLSKEVQNLNKLEYLTINKLNSESNLEHIYKIPSLKEITLLGDKLKEIPFGISNLQNLNKFTLISSPVKQLPSDFKLLSKLKIFRYGEVWMYHEFNDKKREFTPDYEQIFSVLAEIKTLRSVELDNNEIETLHKNIALLTQISKLNLDSNMLDKKGAFPSAFFNLKNLKELKICPAVKKSQNAKEIADNLPDLKIVTWHGY
jgi:Leucine-rich repeat (LRR) protein